jgi:hypothetical protein
MQAEALYAKMQTEAPASSVPLQVDTNWHAAVMGRKDANMQTKDPQTRSWTLLSEKKPDDTLRLGHKDAHKCSQPAEE